MSSTSIEKRIIDLVPRPADVDRLLASLRLLYLDEGIDKFTIDKSKPTITVLRRTSEERGADLSQILEETVRNRPMDEYESEGNTSPLRQIHDMWGMIQDEGLEVAFILTGSRENFSKWFNIRLPRNKPRFFGVPVFISANLPATSFLLCGADTKECYPTDVNFSIRGELS